METESNNQNKDQGNLSDLNGELNENEREMEEEDKINQFNEDQVKHEKEDKKGNARTGKEQPPISNNEGNKESTINRNEKSLDNKDNIIDNLSENKDKENFPSKIDKIMDNKEKITDNKEDFAKEKEETISKQEQDINENGIQLSILQKNSEIISLSNQREQFQIELNSLLNQLNNILIKASSLLNENKSEPQKISRLEYQLSSQKKKLQKIKSQNKIFKEQFEMLTIKSQGSSLEKISVLEFKINELQEDNLNHIKKIRDLKGTQNVKSKELEGYSANIKFPKEIKAYTEELKSLTNKKREYYMKLNQNKKIISSDLLQVTKIEELYQRMRFMTNLPNPLPTGRIEYEINRIKFDLKGTEDDIIKRIDNDDMMIVQEKIRQQQWFSPQINAKKFLKPISGNRVSPHFQQQGASINVNRSSAIKKSKSPRGNNKKVDQYAYFIQHKNKKFISAKDKQSDIIDINKIDDQDLSHITYETLTDYEYRELVTKKEHYYDIIFKLENSIREAKKMYERKIKEMNNTIDSNSKRLVYIEQENELLKSEISDLSKISRLNVEEKQMKNEIKDTSNKILKALQKDQNQNQNNPLAKNEASESRNEILNELDILNNSDADNNINNNQKFPTGILEEDSSSNNNNNIAYHHHHGNKKIKFPDISNVENIDEEVSNNNREKVLKVIKSRYIKANQMHEINIDDDSNNNSEENEENYLNVNVDLEDNKENDKENEENDKENEENEDKQLNKKELKDLNEEVEDQREMNQMNLEEDIVNHEVNLHSKEDKKVVYVDQREEEFNKLEEIDLTHKKTIFEKETIEINYKQNYNDNDAYLNNDNDNDNDGDDNNNKDKIAELEDMKDNKGQKTEDNENVNLIETIKDEIGIINKELQENSFEVKKENDIKEENEVKEETKKELTNNDLNEEQLIDSIKDNENKKESIIANRNEENNKEPIKEDKEKDNLNSQVEIENDYNHHINKDNTTEKNQDNLDTNPKLDDTKQIQPIEGKDKEPDKKESEQESKLEEEKEKIEDQIEKAEDKEIILNNEKPEKIEEANPNNDINLNKQADKSDQFEEKENNTLIANDTKNQDDIPIEEVKSVEDNNNEQEKEITQDAFIDNAKDVNIDNTKDNNQILKQNSPNIKENEMNFNQEDNSKALDQEMEQKEKERSIVNSINSSEDNSNKIEQKRDNNSQEDKVNDQKDETKEREAIPQDTI